MSARYAVFDKKHISQLFAQEFLFPAVPLKAQALVHGTTSVPLCVTALFDALHPHRAGQTVSCS